MGCLRLPIREGWWEEKQARLLQLVNPCLLTATRSYNSLALLFFFIWSGLPIPPRLRIRCCSHPPRMHCDAPLWVSRRKFRQLIRAKLLMRAVCISSILPDPMLIMFLVSVGQGHPHSLNPSILLYASMISSDTRTTPLPPLTLPGPFVYCTLADVVELKLNQPIRVQNAESMQELRWIENLEKKNTSRAKGLRT